MQQQQPTGTPSTPMQPTLTRPITDQAEAQQVVGHLSDVMDALLALVEEETQHVRLGRLTEVPRLAEKKAKLARLYLSDSARLQASQPYLAKAVPGVMHVLRERHNTFRAMLQINLTVLATAHAVAEGIIRGVSDEINKAAAPQVYGATGSRTVPPPRSAQPLAVSRVL
jgi:flagellar biosynthesis/type III secretory pathway chaperone